MRVRLEFKLQDSWVGVYWKKTGPFLIWWEKRGRFMSARILHVWICLVPWFPIHVTTYTDLREATP
jgi:hypothetical protein